MILHIPHSSTKIPKNMIFKSDINRELLRMTDWFTDELYHHEDASRVVLHVSRLVCDVERFADDAQESMSKKGMGVCYTCNSYGEPFRDVDIKEKERILEHYYYPHHQKLTDAVNDELHQEGHSLIVDCHSFPNELHAYHTNLKRPDFCIGSDTFHTPPELVAFAKELLQKKGYEVLVNEPYSGTMVPMKHYGKTKEVASIMIEINRRLYLNEEGKKSSNFEDIQNVVFELLSKIKDNF